ncbi:heme o synthase [Thermostichus vulcanus]|uniref:Protoheme IX farnesyltransferase n=1 Tax=Thermostichus vulcanus str. 'Rupite' TaxID=2813851 RepID=A0ABT0CD78_THEVL|nr:heme o synthase [Thermostichus vulcanus]MCJ2543739.1 protoheme IX farnesyltransferase [Thermostichus vulcanus str. 'Rupite']
MQDVFQDSFHDHQSTQSTQIPCQTRHHQTVSQVFRSYSQLIKPKIIALLLMTTAGAMWMAGNTDPVKFVVTLLGGGMAAAAANAINMVYDADIDQVMERTRHRPLPSGRIQARDALIFAGILAFLSFGLLALFTNLLAAGLAMSGILVYVGVYTHWLKRSSTQNIVIGGAAGAIPPLVGWAAATGELSWAAWVMFAIIFLWTPPHFWALALLKQEDYARARVPMLPVVAGETRTALQILFYALLIVPVSLLLVYPLQVLGSFYLGAAFLLGSLLVWKAVQLLQDPQSRERAGSLFVFANLYLLLLCGAMGLDSWSLTHTLWGQAMASLQGIYTIWMGSLS